MRDYCISADMPNAVQQCPDCTLIDGVLRFANGYPAPNCPGTTWIQVDSHAGTNGTHVYRVVNTPLDCGVLVFLAALIGVILLRKKALD